MAVSPQAIEQARHLGFAGDVEKRLQRMARRAAIITHVHGNRRFDDYVLRVSDGVVVSVNLV